MQQKNSTTSLQGSPQNDETQGQEGQERVGVKSQGAPGIKAPTISHVPEGRGGGGSKGEDGLLGSRCDQDHQLVD